LAVENLGFVGRALAPAYLARLARQLAGKTRGNGVEWSGM
jgi:hypothetical protein